MFRKAINVLLLLLVVGGESWSQAAGDFQFALVPAAIEAVGKSKYTNPGSFVAIQGVFYEGGVHSDVANELYCY